MTDKTPSDDQKRDDLLRRVLALKPMTQAELSAKLRRERAEKKGAASRVGQVNTPHAPLTPTPKPKAKTTR